MKQLGIFFLFLLFAIHYSLFAQKEIVSAATEFIVAKKYAAANHYLDSILKKNPKSVDALMMKGNVILNRAMESLPPANTITKDDESIFYPAIEPKEAILPADTVRAIEKWWRKGLKTDSSRNDIRKGLCTVYAMGLMKAELKKEIAVLVKAEKNEDGEQAYRMAEYARKIKERGQFEEAMEVYQFIAAMYPDLAGLRCDIASEYFYEGKMNEALTWLDSCYNFKTVDETSFLNGAFIYSQLGYFDDAQNVLNTYSNVYQRKMDQFYYGLRLFEESSPNFREVLSRFTQAVDTNAYSTEIYVAQKLLALNDSFSLSEFRLLADDQNIPDYYRVLILSRGVKQFAKECGPFISYGVYQSSVKNYSAAVQFLEEGEHCEMNTEQKERWTIQYGYTLFMAGEQLKAMFYFKPLYVSANVFIQHAAKYFSAKILMERKQKEEAKKLWDQIVSSKEETKYTGLAKQQMQ